MTDWAKLGPLGRIMLGTADPLEFLSGDGKFDIALEFAVSVVSRSASGGIIYVPELDEAAFAVAALTEPVFQKTGYGPGPYSFVGHEFAPVALDVWRSHYEADVNAAQMIRERLAVNDAVGFPIPDGAMRFRGALLSGHVTEARNRTKPTVDHRDTVISGIANTVREGLGFNESAGRERLSGKPVPKCGVTIAAAALKAFSVNVSPAQAGEVTRKKKKLRIDLAVERNVLMPHAWKIERDSLSLRFPFGRADVSMLAVEMAAARDYFG